LPVGCYIAVTQLHLYYIKNPDLGSMQGRLLQAADHYRPSAVSWEEIEASQRVLPTFLDALEPRHGNAALQPGRVILKLEEIILRQIVKAVSQLRLLEIVQWPTHNGEVRMGKS
jgi:hypothetical protein